MRRSPDPHGIVHRDINDVGIRRLDLDVRLPAVVRRDHILLRRRLQLAGLLGLLPHPLYRVHHVLLLGQKSIAQIGRPGDVVIQTLQHIGENHQRLHARIPVLLLRGLR